MFIAVSQNNELASDYSILLCGERVLTSVADNSQFIINGGVFYIVLMGVIFKDI